MRVTVADKGQDSAWLALLLAMEITGIKEHQQYVQTFSRMRY